MTSLLMQRSVTSLVFVLLAVSSVYYAIRLYDLSPNAQIESSISIIENKLQINDAINVRNTKFIIDNGLLTLSANRETNSEERVIFDTKIPVTIPLTPDLNITYSLYLSNFHLATDAGRLYLHMFNGTHAIVIYYDVGHESSEYVYDGCTYLQYKIGNTTDIWINGTRTVWDDLKNKTVPVTESWKITSIVFGLISYSRGSSSNDSPMLAIFDLNGTYLSFGNLSLAEVDLTSITFSWLSFFGLIGSTSTFCVLSAVYLKLSKRASPRKNGP